MENFFVPYTNRSSSSSAAPNQEPTMGMFGSLISPPARFQIRPSSVMTSTTVPADQRSKQEKELAVGSGSSSSNGTNEVETMKTKIIFHPQFPNLLQSYIECQKVGAPAEMAARLDSTWREFESRQRSSIAATNKEESKDPELDQFMEAYNDMLRKYKEEVTRPVQEAMEFIQKIESQLNIITNGGFRLPPTEADVGGSSSSEEEMNGGDGPETKLDPRAEDGELKKHLLRKYSGYLSNLKQELSKKKKVRKLPKEARQRLLSWWELHYKWPYPSESEKAGLAATTGLDQKQINNWFINQRKRHWKPTSEDDGMHFMTTTFMPDAANYRFPT